MATTDIYTNYHTLTRHYALPICRYDTAVKAVGDASVRAAQDSRWTYAVEAKNQCGIAIGFIKSGTKDADSINKCDDFVARLSAPPPPPVPAVSAATALDCTAPARSEEQKDELQSLISIPYAVFCLKTNRKL